MSQLILKKFDLNNPCGSDYKHKDEFLLIEQEIDKNYSVNEEETNWELVSKKSVILLNKHTKDLKILSWWMISSWKIDSFKSLNDSLVIFIKILEKYNNGLFPKSLKAKKNTMLWLEETLSKDILKFKKNEVLKIKDLIRNFESLQNILKNMLGDDCIYFGKIIRQFKKLDDEVKISEILAIKEEKKEIKKTELKSSIIDESSAPSIKEISNKDEANKILFLFKKHSSMLSDYYRNLDTYDLRAMKITRLLSWLNTDGLPEAKNNITYINPPSQINVNKINDLIKENNNKEAFILIQKSIEKSPFWFDGHFKAYELLIQENKLDLAEEVKNYLLAFVNSNEGVINLFFKDESPFANEDTKNFLNIQTKKTNSILENKTSYLEKEKIDVNKQNIKEAMEELQKHYDLSSSMHDKFKIRLEQSKLAISNNEFTMALILLDELEICIEKYNLDEWQPELSLEVYKLLLNNLFRECINTNKLKNAFEKLCKIDISQALNLNTGEIK